jgi:hypothetical protein
VTGRVVTPESSFAFMTLFLIQIKGRANSSSRAERLIIRKPNLAVLLKLRQGFSFLDGKQLLKFGVRARFSSKFQPTHRDVLAMTENIGEK